MTPAEIKQRMTELDDELAAKLRTMGFSHDEVARVLDDQIPAAQRDAEIKDILARELMRQAADPSSGIMDEVIRRVEQQLPQLEAELLAKHRRRRTLLAVGGITAIAAIAAGIYVATRKPAVNPCLTELGPLDRIAKVAGPVQIGMDDDRHGTCDLFLDPSGPHTRSTFRLRREHGDDYAMLKGMEDRAAFTGHETFRAGRYTVDFYIANGPKMSQAELEADIMGRVGKSHDPTGDALAAMPPSDHVALIRHGDVVTEIQLQAERIDDKAARALVTAIVSDWP